MEVVWKWEGWPRGACSPLITPNKATAVLWVLFMVDFFFKIHTPKCAAVTTFKCSVQWHQVLGVLQPSPLSSPLFVFPELKSVPSK